MKDWSPSEARERLLALAFDTELLDKEPSAARALRHYAETGDLADRGVVEDKIRLLAGPKARANEQ